MSREDHHLIDRIVWAPWEVDADDLREIYGLDAATPTPTQETDNG